MKVLEIREKSIKVDFAGMQSLVAKYEDKNGIYFFNQFLQKQYAIAPETQTKVEIPKAKAKAAQKTGKKYFSFYVEYKHKGRERGWESTTARIKAKDAETALEIVKKRFKVIYEIAEM